MRGARIYVLQHLFQGGPAPIPIQGPQPGPCALPATGQTKCYDDLGNETPCDSEDFPGQDGDYQAGCPKDGRFVDNGDGTVTDNCTGLMWQKDTASGNTWQGALKYCENLSLAGYSDWRLPNVRELQSIVDYNRFGPCFDPIFGTQHGWCFSSTTVASEPNKVWLVRFWDGDLPINTKSNPDFVRAVRTAP